jgi:aminoglycoside phosphotransferase (APT) family kinase protein
MSPLSAASDVELSERLSAVLEPRLGPGVTVDDLVRLAGGSSRESWRFTARATDGTAHRYVLRRDPPGSPTSGVRLESQLLSAAAAAGVPVPTVVAAGGIEAGLGAEFVVVDFLEGETIPRRILRDDRLAGARAVLATQCGEVLAVIHRIPPADVPGLPRGDQLEQLQDLLDEIGQPHPAFELGLVWLRANRPPLSSEVVVHGDFRNGNLIVGPAGIRAVLDWELAHVGDPLEDLGWLCVKSWRFGSPLPVGGFGRIEELVAAYERASDRHVDPEALYWWQVLETLRWGIICIVQTMTHISGAVRSVELAAIGRRVAEVEWDLLEMLP